MSMQAVVMAAGKGTRMKSDLVKVAHRIAGWSVIEWVVAAAFEAGCDRVVVVVGHQADVVREIVGKRFADRVAFAVQDPQKGTGHAVWCARDAVDTSLERTLVLSGDVPNMLGETLKTFSAASQGAALNVMTAVLEDAERYGRIVRRASGRLQAIVEHADADEATRAIREINTGIYDFRTGFLFDELDILCSGTVDNAQGEYYITDLIEVAAQRDDAVATVLRDVAQMRGVNNFAQLAEAATWRRARINQTWMQAGVRMEDPAATYIDADVRLEAGVALQPGVQLIGNTTIEAGARIASSCVIENSSVGPDVDLLPFCHLEDAKVEAGARLGPMCHLRPGADIGPDCHVGNFVEVKKARLDAGAKANHHSYIGDGHIGAGANIGAGTIFCNYDGYRKHFTRVGIGTFIGSNSALVAPVDIADGAYVAAGSVVTSDVPEDGLAVARGRQRNIEGWAKGWRAKNEG